MKANFKVFFYKAPVGNHLFSVIPMIRYIRGMEIFLPGKLQCNWLDFVVRRSSAIVVHVSQIVTTVERKHSQIRHMLLHRPVKIEDRGCCLGIVIRVWSIHRGSWRRNVRTQLLMNDVRYPLQTAISCPNLMGIGRTGSTIECCSRPVMMVMMMDMVVLLMMHLCVIGCVLKTMVMVHWMMIGRCRWRTRWIHHVWCDGIFLGLLLMNHQKLTFWRVTGAIGCLTKLI